LRLTSIPYREDSAELFEAIADEPWAVFLDSGRPRSTAGRLDILAARPFATLVTRGGMTEIRRFGEVRLSPADPFTLLREELGADGRPGPLPFGGGRITMPMRPIHVVAFSEMWNFSAMTSFMADSVRIM